MSIILKVEGYCENCNEFEPDVDRNTYEYNSVEFLEIVSRTTTTVTCKHAQRCRGMIEYLKRQPVQVEGAKDE